VPGIRAMFSMPERLWSTAQVTKSCQFSPAATSMRTSVLVSLRTLMPESLILAMVPGKSLVNRMLAPEPRKKTFSGGSLLMSSAVFISMRLLALAEIRSVL